MLNNISKNENRFVILGAGRNKTCAHNPSLIELKPSQSFINWQLGTSQVLACKKVDYVGGYQLDNVRNILPEEIHITYNPQWSTTGALYSLLLLDFSETKSIYVTYNDIILDDSYVESIFYNTNDCKLSCLVDQSFPKRYGQVAYNCEVITDTEGGEGEFVGFLYIPLEGINFLRKLQEKKQIYKKEYLSDLVLMFKENGIIINYIDCQNNWCDINIPEDKTRLILRGKAKALENLRKIAKKSQYLDQVSFSTLDWIKDQKRVFNQVRQKIKSKLVVIRSSASLEDNFLASGAGAFESWLGVDLEAFDVFSQAVDKTIASYNTSYNLNDLVLIQPYIKNAQMHGVVFTQTHNGGPYYIFNYILGNNTEEVTAGTSRDHETFYLYKNAQNICIPEHLKKIHEAVVEIEEILGYNALDIEFVIDEDDKCIILQARPQLSHKNACVGNEEALSSAIIKIKQQIEEYQTKTKDLFGNIKSTWAVMPDWNPAEIIGRKPSPLALTLYEELVTKETWAQQRAEFGYHDLSGYPLMKNFYGLPYIDVKASFLSFIPANIERELALKIVSSALSYLTAHPYLHDKVEFQVIPTCYRFDFVSQYGHILSDIPKNKIKFIIDQYKTLTRNGVKFDSGRDLYCPLPYQDNNSIETIFGLLKNCKKGVLSFAHEARKAFIATNLLKSLVSVGAMNEEELSDFYHSIHTISRQFSEDAFACKQGKLSIAGLIKKYGHLRPGTYDITAPRYDSAPEIFLHPIIEQAQPPQHLNFRWKNASKKNIEKCLKDIDGSLTPEEFIRFAKDSIASRELVKFEFTKDLSQALECIKKYGASLGLPCQDVSFVNIEFLKILLNSFYYGREGEMLQYIIKENKRLDEIKHALEMPIIFSEPNDIDCFDHPSSMANFISSHKIIGEVIHLEKNYKINLNNKIVLIENADPGFDWIFGEQIAGLVTMYGGVNSHMAVRAAECNIPAAIGIGEKKFNEFVNQHMLCLDCKNKKIFSVK